MRPILGIFVSLGFLALAAYSTYKIFSVGTENIDKEILVIWGMSTQALILMMKDGFGFYFGTSQGSSNKSETIDKMLNGGPPPSSTTE